MGGWLSFEEDSPPRRGGPVHGVNKESVDSKGRGGRKQHRRANAAARASKMSIKKNGVAPGEAPVVKMLPSLGYNLISPASEGPRAKKSLITTYVLWLFGGIFGAHHLYLGRDAQAFLWWSTLGGYFGAGWIRDLFVIPKYVKAANQDPEYLQKLIDKIKANPTPPFSGWRFAGQVIFGYLFSSLTMYAIPDEQVAGIDWHFIYFLIPAAAALGVWLVGNLGTQEGNIWWALGAAYASYPLCMYLEDETTWFSLMVVGSAMAFDNMSKRWRRTPPKKRRLPTRVAVLLVCACLYLSLWTSYMYFNAKITDSEGEEIPVNEAIHHFFTSPWWLDVWQSLKDVYVFAQHHGWYETWKQIIDLADPQGEINAHKVLGVSTSASQDVIKAAYRALSKEHHPDKQKDPSKRAAAQEKFMEIQQAYELLSNSKNRRRVRNRRSA